MMQQRFHFYYEVETLDQAVGSSERSSSRQGRSEVPRGIVHLFKKNKIKDFKPIRLYKMAYQQPIIQTYSPKKQYADTECNSTYFWVVCDILIRTSQNLNQ